MTIEKIQYDQGFFNLQLFGGGSTQQTTNSNQTTNQNANSLQSFINNLISQSTSATNAAQNTTQNSLANTLQNQNQQTSGTQTGTTTGQTAQNTQGQTVSGATVAAPELSTLAQIQNFDTNQMNNGISQASMQQALQQNQTQDAQTINQVVHAQGGSGSNTAGLVSDLGQQAIMGNAQTAANIAAANQGYEAQGAQNLQTETQIANPLTQYTNNSQGTTGTSAQSSQENTLQNLISQLTGTQTGSQTGTQTGTQNTTNQTGTMEGGQTAASQTGSSNTQGTQTTNTSQTPSFGSLLGALLPMIGGAFTGGSAAGVGGSIGSILTGI